MTIPHKSFYFIRHGETDWNKRGIIMGSTDIALNSHGISQAQQAKYHLENIGITHIYSSPLKRASQTAAILNEGFALPVTYSDLLKERSWGVSEGDSVDKFKEILKRPIHSIEDHEIPEGAETWNDLKNRITKILKQILENKENVPLVVAHGGFFRGLSTILQISHAYYNNCELCLCTPPTSLNECWKIKNL